YTAVVGGVLALLLIGEDKKEILESLNYKDIVFFFCLFIMVGGLDASGFLNIISYYIWIFAGTNEYLQSSLLLFFSGIFTIFLNAGPATAVFLPVAGDLSYYAQNEFIFWALSLGVCAGSSAALTGATAGCVASNYMSEYGKKLGFPETEFNKYYNLSFREFLKIGLPFMGIFMVISLVYLWVRFV
ncbi:MAG: hypothetical protein HQK84_08625, partial [Nitrospinae bacterium]|nr:hypothetical protein [Nitrospinota bacterium]